MTEIIKRFSKLPKTEKGLTSKKEVNSFNYVGNNKPMKIKGALMIITQNLICKSDK